MKIIKLDESIQNLIAAGEVVERPLSIVKELVENSIDAKADMITVSLINSGISLIKVSDNGKGMDKEDALMSIERHATSKLRDKNDLFNILSLGFRGEALASIASISNFTLTTSDGTTNTKVHVKGGKLLDVSEVAFNRGTEIVVENMFYNTPARLKFLKSEQFELALVTEFITKISLAYENIAFKLINNNKVILQTTKSGDVFKTLAEVYSVEVARKMNHLTFSNYDYKVDAYFSSPELTRSNKNNITIIVNNRVVKNYLIVNKIIESYKDKLFAKRYPIALLKITCDPLLVDVNVHPSKQELKYTDEAKLLDLIYTNLNQYLFKKVESKYEVVAPKVIEKSNIIEETIVEHEKITPLINEVLVTKEEEKAKVYDFEPVFKNETLRLEDIKEEVKPSFPKLSYIGQVFKTYLLFEATDGFYIVDQHAAAERINYEIYYEKLHTKTNDYYDLLVPLVFDFDLGFSLKIKEKHLDLSKNGINLEELSDRSFMLRSVPTWFIKGKEKDMALEIIEATINDKSLNILDNLAKSLACKASLKGNSLVRIEEINYLMENLAKCKNPYNCPHGRPTLIKYAKYELERMFKRA